MTYNIVILVDRFDSLGGVQRWANMLASEFNARGHRVHLLGLRRPPEGSAIDYRRSNDVLTFYLSEEEGHVARSGVLGKLRGVARRLPGPVSGTADRLLKGWRPEALDSAAVGNLRRYLNELPDGSILIATTRTMLSHVSATGVNVGPGTSLPVVAQCHNAFSYLQDRPRLLKAFRDACSIANVVVFLTDEDSAAASVAGFESVCEIPNPAPPLDSTAVDRDRSNVVVALGRLDQQKSFDRLVRAWAQIAPRYPDWELHIYGTGAMEEALGRLIARLNLSSAKLMGLTDEPTAILSDAAIHALTSQNEGWGLVVSEASAVGTPTVAFDNGPGVRAQIVDGQTGILVRLNDVGDLAEQLERLILHPDLRRGLGERAFDLVAGLSSERIAAKWERLFSNVSAL